MHTCVILRARTKAHMHKGKAHMDITLRKANALQTAINEVINGLDLSTEVEINEFQSPKSVIENTAELFTENLVRRGALIDALYEIRALVSRANTESGINDALVKLARNEKQMGFYNRLSKIAPMTEMDVITGQLGKIKSRDASDLYGRREDVVRTNILQIEDIENFTKIAKNLKREKQKIQDELLELNVQTYISLSESTVKSLQEEDIL